MTSQPTDSRLESKIDRLQQDVVTLAQVMRDGFSRVYERFDRIDDRFAHVDKRFDEVIDIVSRIYEEHGNRLKDIEARLTPNTHA